MTKQAHLVLGSLTTALAFTLATLAAPSPARAQATAIETGPAEDWAHHHTKIALPVRIAGFSRQALGDLSRNQLDVSALYQESETGTWATVYLYHAGLVDASVWHDRAVTTIFARYPGKVDSVRAATSTFTPRGHGRDSGIRTSFPMLDPKVASTGVAIFPHEHWLLKVRMSSTTLSAERLDVALTGFVEAIPVPVPDVMDTAAYRIEDCTEPLPTKEAKRAAADLSDALIASAVWSEIEQREATSRGRTSNDRTPRTLCRDADGTDGYGVYRDRDDGKKDRYLIAFGDAGTVITVGPGNLSRLIGKRQREHSAVVRTLDSVLVFTPFEEMPTPSQVVALLGKEAPMTSVTRGVNPSGK